MDPLKKICGNALIFTIAISLISGIFCSCLLLLGYYNRLQQSTAHTEQRLQANIRSATNIVLADTSFFASSRRDTIDLFDEGTDTVTIHRMLWGLYKLAGIDAYSGKYVKRVSFLYGSELPSYMDACIYLADHQRSLSVSGNTILNGNAYLSKGGIKAAYIEQKGFAYDTMLRGKILESGQQLPAADKRFIEYLYQLSDASTHAKKSISPNEIDTGISVSFQDTMVEIFSDDDISLENVNLEGHIIVRSNASIEVSHMARLRNIILAAPVVRFEKNCNVSVQVIATDSIILKRNTVIEYPSSLILLKRDKEKDQPVFLMEDGAIVNGIIASICKPGDVQKNFAGFKAGSILRGIAYCSGYVSLAGKVEGIVLTDYFIYRTSSAVYENYLVDVTIDRNRLSSYFSGSALFSTSTSQKIVEWTR
jgi:hypothetical protein